MKKIILTIAVIGAFFSGKAQQENFRKCGVAEQMELIRAQDPVAYDLKRIEQEAAFQEWLVNEYPAIQALREVITIPIVFHIWEDSTLTWYNRAEEQLQTLNEDFGKMNADTGDVPNDFKSIAANLEVEFCKATFDPDGNPTNGVVWHTAGGSPGNGDLWDPSSYLNIYVYSLGGGILGYTSLPSGNPNTAVNIASFAFGSTGASSPYNKGRTATHEVGHWLDLWHTWGDANCGNDYVDDTPDQQSPNYSCPNYPSVSCDTKSDMFMNFMDYTDDGCMYMFSEGQKARVVYALNNYRTSLLTADGCRFATGISENKSISEIYIRPNPSTGIFNIQVNELDAEVSILNVSGQVVMSQKLNNSNVTTVDLSNFTNGMYFVAVKTSKGISTKKISLMK